MVIDLSLIISFMSHNPSKSPIKLTIYLANKERAEKIKGKVKAFARVQKMYKTLT